MKSPSSDTQCDAFWEEPLTPHLERRQAALSLPRGRNGFLKTWLMMWRKGSSDDKSQVRPRSFALARPRRMRQTARGLLWWIPFWYVLAQIALVVWMNDHWQPLQVRVEHRKWKQLHRRIAEAPDSPLVLMLGSSRTDWAFQASCLTGQKSSDGRPLLAYNMGVPTTGPLHEALYLNDLLDEGVRPRLVLVEFPTTHFNQPRRGIISEESFTLGPWLSAHQVQFLTPYLANARKAWKGWMEAHVAPWYAYRWSVHEHLQGLHTMERPLDQARQPMDKWGSRQLMDDPGTPEYRWWRKDRARAMYFESLQRFKLGRGPYQAFHNLLQRCRTEGVGVALVVMPEAREFHRMYPPECAEQLQRIVADVRDEFGVPVLDASEWLSEEDFDDGHHVLRVGGQKYSKRLATEVLELLAQTNR